MVLIAILLVTGLEVHGSFYLMGFDQAVIVHNFIGIIWLIAFGLLMFLVVHVYLTTTGHTIFAHTKGMITGWEKVDEGTVIHEWEQKEKMNHRI
jgi:thiosulfate reductase cytochrome b subunit